MYILLSPAKKLVEPPAADLPATEPELLDQTLELMQTARRLSSADLQRLMRISEPLGDLNRARFQSFSTPFNRENARQAALSFAGDVYVGLDAGSLSAEDLEWAQSHVGILSGLYGLLRPLDLMQPYRLEMGTPLENPRGSDLYAFWGERIAEAIRAHLDGLEDPTVVNLASNEYFRSVDTRRLGQPVITPVFQDVKDGKARTISFFAKKARGMMARWAILNRVERAEALKRCDAGGYRFDPEASSGSRWVFRRPQPPSPA